MSEKRDDAVPGESPAAPAAEATAAPVGDDALPGADVPAAPLRPQPAVEAATAPPARRGSAWPGVAAAILTVVLAIATLASTVPWWGPMLAEWTGTATEARVAAIEDRLNQEDVAAGRLAARLEAAERGLTGLRDDLTALRNASAAGNDATGPLAQRIARLEAAATAAERIDPQSIAALAQEAEQRAAEIGQLRERVDVLAKSSADAATVLRLADRVDAAEAAAREAAAKRGSAQALLLAVGQLREAVNRGDAFASELRAVGAVLEGGDAAADIEKLARYGQRGIPTRAALAAGFEGLAGRIVRADIGPDEDGLWRQTIQRLASLITVRRTEGEAAQSTPGIVARAEAKLRAGDLAGGVAELSALEGHALETAGPWMADARARLTADKALSDLTARAVALTARSEG